MPTHLHKFLLILGKDKRFENFHWMMARPKAPRCNVPAPAPSQYLHFMMLHQHADVPATAQCPLVLNGNNHGIGGMCHTLSSTRVANRKLCTLLRQLSITTMIALRKALARNSKSQIATGNAAFWHAMP